MYKAAKKLSDANGTDINEYQNFVIDIFAEDYSVGGGMDQLTLDINRVDYIEANDDKVNANYNTPAEFNIIEGDAEGNGKDIAGGSDQTVDVDIDIQSIDEVYTENSKNYKSEWDDNTRDYQAYVDDKLVGTMTCNKETGAMTFSVEDPSWSGIFKFKYTANYKGKTDSAVVTVVINSNSYVVEYYYQISKEDEEPFYTDSANAIKVYCVEEGTNEAELTEEDKNPTERDVNFEGQPINTQLYELDCTNPSNGIIQIQENASNVIKVYFKLKENQTTD